MSSAEPDPTFVRRTRLAYWVLLTVVAVFVGRLYFLQVVSGERFRDDSQANSVKNRQLEAPRGLIRDTHGRLLVGNRRSHDLVLDRERLEDADAVAAWVARVVGEDAADVRERMRRHEDEPAFRPVVLARDLTFSQVAWIEARREDQPALFIQTRVLRQYPHGSLAAHVLGHVGEVDAEELLRPDVAAYHRRGDLIGKTGVERRYDRVLSGRRGTERVVVDNLGREIDQTVAEPPRSGAEVHLTLDLELQRVAERALAGRRGACVVLDPRDGAVRVLASSPAYEPEAFVGGISVVRWRQYADDELEPLRFRAIGEVYPPGSVWKALVSAAVLESGVHGTDHAVTCLGQVGLYGRPRRCWKTVGHGVVDMHRALVHSCNVYYYLAGRDAGHAAIARLADEFGFGQPTGIDVPGEAAGTLPSDAWKRRELGEPWYPGDTINLAIGQGYLSTTPLQVAVLAMAIGNGGDVWRPHVFSHAVDGLTAEVVQDGEPWLLRHARLSESTTRFLRDAMVAVVDGGTARRARVSGVAVAGKTGTAQPSSGDAPPGIPQAELPLRYREHAWFMGFAPAEEPEVAFAVVLEHAGAHGGEVAAPVAREVLEAHFGGTVLVSGQ